MVLQSLGQLCRINSEPDTVSAVLTFIGPRNIYGLPKKVQSTKFLGSHNLYITTTLKHDLFPFLVCKEGFWKDKSFVWIFSEPPTSLNWIFGIFFPPEILILAGSARSFPSLLEGVLTSIDLSFTTFGLVKSWWGERSLGGFFLWWLSVRTLSHCTPSSATVFR